MLLKLTFQIAGVHFVDHTQSMWQLNTLDSFELYSIGQLECIPSQSWFALKIVERFQESGDESFYVENVMILAITGLIHLASRLENVGVRNALKEHPVVLGKI